MINVIVNMKVFNTIIFVFLTSFVLGQKNFKELEKETARYNDYFVNADNAIHRIYAHKKFKSLFEKALRTDSAFYYSFDSLKWISKLIAPDSSFRVFSWQLDISAGKKEYYGYIQMRNGLLYELKDNKEWFSDLEYEVFTPDDWYGQLYYNLYQYKNKDKNEYILFGYKQLTKYDKIKVAAPVYFEEDNIFFGKEIFQDTLRQEGLKNRIVLQTANEAASKLNYDENMGIIIYDHTTVIPLKRSVKAGPAMVPDGSYHGYKLDGGKWIFIDKVFNQIYDENSIPGRKKKDKEKNLFGNDIKKK